MLPCIVQVDGTVYLNPWFLESKRQDVSKVRPNHGAVSQWAIMSKHSAEHPLHQWQPV